MSADSAGAPRGSARDLLRALFAEAKRRARRRRGRQLLAAVSALAIAAVIVLIVGGGGGGGGAASPHSVRVQLASRLRTAAAVQRLDLNALGSTPDLKQLMSNFAVLRAPQSAADRSWHPQCDCAGSARQLGQLTRFAAKLPHGYRVFLDVEQFIAGGQLNTPAGSYMLNLDIVDRYGNTDSTSFGANTQYTVEPLSTDRPSEPKALAAGGAALASVVPDGVTKVSWTFACPRGSHAPSAAGSHGTVVVPVINNVAAKWLPSSPAQCPGTMKVVWLGAGGRVLTSFDGGGNLSAPPFVKGKLGHGTERLLTSSGIGNTPIGSSASKALAALTKRFGTPADSTVAVQGCTGGRQTVWTSPALANPLAVYTEHGRFVGYQYGAGANGAFGKGPGAELATARGLTLGSSVGSDRSTYPSGFATLSSAYVGYWSAFSDGSRFYGAASPDRYPAHTVAAGDRVSTIGAGSFPKCTQTSQSRRFPVLPAPGARASLQTRALYYLRLAYTHTRRSGVCAITRSAGPKTLEGAPSQALLADLAVLRRSSTATDTLPRSLRGNAPSGRFVKYIRLAASGDGLSYYIVPSSSPSQSAGFVISPRCITAEMTAVRAEARGLPGAVRAKTLALSARAIAQQRLMSARQTGDGVCLLFAGRDHVNGGSCGATASDLKRWGMTSTMGKIAGIVPDGVAAVRVHVPADNGLRATTVHAKVVNNVFITPIEESFGFRRQPKVVWLSASGKVINTVPARVPGVATSGWCGGC